MANFSYDDNKPCLHGNWIKKPPLELDNFCLYVWLFDMVAKHACRPQQLVPQRLRSVAIVRVSFDSFQYIEFVNWDWDKGYNRPLGLICWIVNIQYSIFDLVFLIEF